MKHLVIFLAGVIFSLGLIVSGMVNPAKVLGFLDLFGAWDPSLAFVMGGAVAVTFVGFKLVLKRGKPLFENQFSLPTRIDIDRDLLLGASLFGVGWGLVGLCPGPALAALPVKPFPAIVFMLAMLAGMYVPRLRSRFIRKGTESNQTHQPIGG